MLPFAGVSSFFRSLRSQLALGLGGIALIMLAAPIDRPQIDRLCALLDAQDFEAGQCFDALAPALCAHIGATLFGELAGRMAELDFKGASLLLEPYGTREKDLPS